MKNLLFIFATLFLGLFACHKGDDIGTPNGEDFQSKEIATSLEKAVTDPSVILPLYGNYSTSSDAIKWYNSTGSAAHKAYSTFDDTYAYDLNLQGDRDQNLSVVSPFSGTVTNLGSTFPGTTTGGTYGAVLIDIGNNNFIGFMHLKNIKVVSGDKITAGQWIGNIGSTGVTNNHLHFSYYTKDSKGILKSKAVKFSDRTFTLALTWKDSKIVLKPKISSQITATVPFGDKGQIESKAYFNNTYWTSDDSKTATVNGNGLVTGVKIGTTTIRLKFSGKEFTFPVTVK